MTLVDSDARKSAQPPTATDYDAFAEGYATETEDNLVNGHYARPAIVDLAGDVAGRTILDAGCGSGPILEVLRDRGAAVAGFDSSAAMVELARRRLGPDVELTVADLGAPLPYPDDTFDDVVASLVLHYLEDWSAPLAELRRVLVPGGRLIIAVNHPFVFPWQHRDADYFSTVQYSEEYTFGGQTAVLVQWHRPLHAMIDAFTAAGFRVAVLSEPPPAPDARRLFPDELPTSASGAFVCFVFFVLEAA